MRGGGDSTHSTARSGGTFPEAWERVWKHENALDGSCWMSGVEVDRAKSKHTVSHTLTLSIVSVPPNRCL